MASRPEPSPEVKKIIGEFCRIQREKYGEDWKKILAKEMAAKTTPVLEALLKLQKKPS
jgi:hypothetical protein